MNVTELARKLRINTKQLLEILPEYGFDIGKRAIKIDDRTAEQVVKQWNRIKKDLDLKKQKEIEERKEKEKELRREEGVVVVLPELVTVRLFAEKLDMSVTAVITELMKNGILANQNQNIDYDTAAIMAEELGFVVSKEEGQASDVVADDNRESDLEEALSKSEHMETRAPVIVVMGHVDHGKTTLLDAIRQANVVSTESGGITQHIGAYQTIWIDPKTKVERPITFIDTPGHEAFTVMRSRGAKVADIAILIVSADDGVQPQTKEAIQIIKAAKLPHVVAVNKIDKDGADPTRVRTDLASFGVQTEEWGGEISFVDISAKNNQNIDKLLDMLLLTADMNEDGIKADATMPAIGTVIESHVDKGMGPVATILVQGGTLRKGDSLTVNGEIYGKVRAMKTDKGIVIDEAPPSMPAQIIGFKVAPEVGDVLDNAKEGSANKIDVKQKRTEQTGAVQHSIIDQSVDDSEDEKKKKLNIVLKADVLGSLEAIIGSLDRFKHDEVSVKVVGKGLGNITEDDVMKAEASGATVIGFHVKATTMAEEKMKDVGVEFKRYEVIYDLINWLRNELELLLDSEKIVHELGNVKILAIFRTDKGAMTIGGRVETGKVETGAMARVKRDGEIIGEGVLSTLQTGQQEVKKVPGGTECGMRFEGKVIIAEGDIIEAYKEERKTRKIEFDVAK
jgi:translation initiation factor IF-2